MEEVQYYFISVGEKSYFYTLRYFFHKKVWRTHENGIKSFDVVTGSRHVRNLNHDFDEAVRIAKEYMAKHKYASPLKTTLPKENMSDRADVTSITSYDEKIAKQIFLSGKYIGCHVSEVDKGYVHWAVLNLHNEHAHIDQKRRNTTLINGQICFNYASEQGWLQEWIKLGEELLGTANDSDIDEINKIINSDVFQCGKYRNESLSDFGYTKKKELRSKVVDYLIYMSNQQTKIDKALDDENNKFVSHDDGVDDVFITTETLKKYNLTAHSILHDSFILTVLICRHLCRTLGIGRVHRFTKYIFTSVAVEFTDNEKIRRALNHHNSQTKYNEEEII